MPILYEFLFIQIEIVCSLHIEWNVYCPYFTPLLPFFDRKEVIY